MTELIYPRDFFRSVSDVVDERLCFVLMPFANEYRRIYDDAIRPTVEGAGLRCMRADQVFSTSPVLVDIMEHIAKATLVIADLTGRSPNVFYELGLTHVAKENAAVILLAQGEEHIPFDLRHLRVIIYDGSDAGVESLRKNLRGTLEWLGYVKEGSKVETEKPLSYRLEIGSVTAPPGAEVDVDVTVEAPAPGIGYYRIDVAYNSELVTALYCEATRGVCNPAFDDKTVRFVGATADGLMGAVKIGSVRFRLGEKSGEAYLRLIVGELGDPSSPPRHADHLEVTNGRILIQAT